MDFLGDPSPMNEVKYMKWIAAGSPKELDLLNNCMVYAMDFGDHVLYVFQVFEIYDSIRGKTHITETFYKN